MELKSSANVKHMCKAEAWRQASKQARHSGILRGCRQGLHLREATGGREEAREPLPNGRVEERRGKRKRASTLLVEEWEPGRQAQNCWGNRNCSTQQSYRAIQH